MTVAPTQTGPRISHYAAFGAVMAGVVGGVVGLAIGLAVNPGTAWFALFELGVPASMLGALVGVICSLIAQAIRAATARSR